MCEGEVFQIEKSDNLDISEKDYFDLIDKKTSLLLSTSCQIGGLLAKTNKDNILKLKNFGISLGRAFQIQDDLLDYSGNSNILGKSIMKDLDEKKITLPLIYAFEKLKEEEIKKIKKQIKRGLTKQEKKDIIKIAHETGGYKKAQEKAKCLVKEGCEYIKDLPIKEHRDKLIEIAEFIVNRSF